MFTFARFGVARNAPVFIWINKRFGAARQNLVSVTLVRNIVDNFVLWGIKNVMQGDCPLHKPQVRRQVATALGNLVQKCRANFGRQRFQAFRVHLFHICRGCNLFHQHKEPSLKLRRSVQNTKNATKQKIPACAGMTNESRRLSPTISTCSDQPCTDLPRARRCSRPGPW